MSYVRITKMVYKHNQLKGIKKNPQIDPKGFIRIAQV